MKLRKRTLPGGGFTFFLDDFHNGVRVRESLGVVIPPKSGQVFTKNQQRLAETLFQKRQAEILLTRKGLVRDGDLTLVDYGKKLAQGRHSSDHVFKVIPYLEKHFEAMELKAVDYRACEAFQGFLVKSGLAPKTTRHYFAALSFILNEAVRDRYLELNPAQTVRRLRVPEKVVLALGLEDLQKLWATPAGSPYGEVVKEAFFLSVNSGLRFSDIRSLRWGDISTQKGDWKLAKAQDKTGGVIFTPLNSPAVEILTKRFKLDPEALVFPEFQTGTAYQRYLGPWVQAAGVTKPATFHTARHTYGTNLAGLGTNTLTIKNLMGHTTSKMTEHYTQAAGSEARALVERLPDVSRAKVK